MCKPILNTGKTEYIIFRPPISNCEKRITLSLNRNKLYESTIIRYLGLLLDNKLHWRGIGLLSTVKHFCSSSVLRSLYFSLFISHLSHCISVCGGNLREMLINKMKKLQNRCPPSLNIPVYCDEIRKRMHTLNIEKKLKYQILPLTWNNHHNTVGVNSRF